MPYSQESLRRAVWNIKREENITFKQMAEDLGLSYKSLLNWNKGLYDFGDKRTARLIKLIAQYQGGEKNAEQRINVLDDKRA